MLNYKFLKTILLVLCFLQLFLLNGCTFLTSGESVSNDPDQLIAEHRYQLARQLLTIERNEKLEQLERTNAQRVKLSEDNIEQKEKLEADVEAIEELITTLDQKLAAIPKASSEHQAEIIKQLASLRKEGEWQEADRQLVVLESNVLPNQDLEDYRVTFDTKRRQAITRLEYELLMLESRQLPARVELYRSLANAGYGDSSIYSRLQSEQDQKKRVISALRERAKMAEQEGKLNTSLRYLAALSKLENSDAVKADLRRMKTWIASNNQKKQASSKSKFEAVYNKAINEKDWLQARELLDAELKRQPNDKDLQAMDSRLKDIYLNQVNQAKQAGEQRYTEGEIEEALKLWEDALPYAPDDVDLLTNVQRAKKILNKLETLKSESAATPSVRAYSQEPSNS